MHIGLFFGSFNPIHIGHLALANYMSSYTNMQQVWLVVSPHNPLKNKSQLLNQNDRLQLVNLALDFHPTIKASNFEFDLPQPSYTINTLARLKEKFPEHEFSLIMGQDNLQSFNKWKNYEEILKRHHIYVYPRPNCSPSDFDTHPNVHLTEAPMMDISSTFIRNAIKEKKDVQFFMHPKVWEEIDLMNYYKK
ncbi:MAG: nicotinate (nicotinamide) nucleotide adenylyltransferase [Bacteroidota bacterium]|nr:nicotinate (nicotinamide) nucleotide adenylyltransferase [Bacteroidota bacterium]MDP3143937.1 nicotinate (nicotinamide) nucleotide adenylyltransferase [Bacteroidota bacterium]MDP3557564.1 nicotinate (nicotinamide) nucleotide adenylyltransferase [Bacteroidota bacterium]